MYKTLYPDSLTDT